jgi:hypothetical protein
MRSRVVTFARTVIVTQVTAQAGLPALQGARRG